MVGSGSHGSQVTWGHFIQSQLLEVGTLALHTGSQVLSPKHDMDAYNMATLFGGEAWDLVLKVGSSKKVDSTLNTSPVILFLHKIIKIRLLRDINNILMISWDLKGWILPPCWDSRLGTVWEPTLKITRIDLVSWRWKSVPLFHMLVSHIRHILRIS